MSVVSGQCQTPNTKHQTPNTKHQISYASRLNGVTMPQLETTTVVLYDIPHDRTRTKVSNKCLDFGLVRFQYSAFHGRLTRNRREELGLLLEAQFGVPLPHGYVVRLPDDSVDKVAIDGPLRDLTFKTMQALRNTIRRKLMPAANPVLARCVDCGHEQSHPSALIARSDDDDTMAWGLFLWHLILGAAWRPIERVSEKPAYTGARSDCSDSRTASGCRCQSLDRT
ncbi:MAG TPA: CRISPR-associated endonuclease Cas2 [Planctomycetaceae bacterium]